MLPGRSPWRDPLESKCPSWFICAKSPSSQARGERVPTGLCAQLVSRAPKPLQGPGWGSSPFMCLLAPAQFRLQGLGQLLWDDPRATWAIYSVGRAVPCAVDWCFQLFIGRWGAGLSSPGPSRSEFLPPRPQLPKPKSSAFLGGAVPCRSLLEPGSSFMGVEEDRERN